MGVIGTMTNTLQTWTDDSNEYECPRCGGTALLSAIGSNGVKVRCKFYDCGEYQTLGMNWEDMYYRGEPILVYPDESWTVGDPTTVMYECPNCESNDIQRRPHDDGCGYVNVQLVCRDCDKSSWG